MRWQKLDSSRQVQAPLVNTCRGHRVVGQGTCRAAARALAMPVVSKRPSSRALCIALV